MSILKKPKRNNYGHKTKPVLKCNLCHLPLNKNKKTKDHRVPRWEGGGNNDDNLFWTHADCNCLKGHNFITNFKEARPIFAKFLQALRKHPNKEQHRYNVYQHYRKVLVKSGIMIQQPDDRELNND